jgi:hypothetical protein
MTCLALDVSNPPASFELRNLSIRDDDDEDHGVCRP